MSGIIDVDVYSRVPIYEQVVERVCALVVSGGLNNEDKLPSVRQLARELGVNPNTVQKAYTELMRRGIIGTAPGRGNFIAAGQEAICAVRGEILEAVRQSLKGALENGISRGDIMKIVEDIFGKGEAL